MGKGKRKATTINKQRYLVALVIIVIGSILFGGVTTGQIGGTVPEGAEYTPLFIKWTCMYFGLAVLAYCYLRAKKFVIDEDKMSFALPIVMIGAFAVQLVVSANFKGFYYDIGTNMAWAYQAGTDLFNIYNTASFIDYPPGMMYLWAPLAWINTKLGGSYEDRKSVV